MTSKQQQLFQCYLWEKIRVENIPIKQELTTINYYEKKKCQVDKQILLTHGFTTKLLYSAWFIS